MAFGDWLRKAGVSATFTRPNDTTAYASGDLVANSTTAGSVVPMSLGAANGLLLRSVSVKKSGTGVSNASFRVHFFALTQTVTNGDNGAIIPSDGDSYLGSADVTVDRVCEDGAVGCGLLASPLPLAAPGGTVFALLEARGAYTPAAQEVFVVTLFGGN